VIGFVWSLAAACAAAVLYGTSSVLQAQAAGRGAAVTDLLRRPAYLVGLAFDGIAWLLSLLALRHLPLFVVQSVLAGSLAVTAVLGHVVLRVPLRRSAAVAVGVLVAALVVLAGCGGHQPAPTTSGAVRLGLLVAAVALLVLAVLARSARPVGLALLAGLAYSGAALGARALQGHSTGFPQLLAQPLAYAVLLYGVAGTYAYAQALERGEVTAVTATLWSVEVVVPAVVGLSVLGDTVRPGWWPALVLSLLAVLSATLLLARTDTLDTPLSVTP
jgi:drug/metabolite transporter (DMT)-like permease